MNPNPPTQASQPSGWEAQCVAECRSSCEKVAMATKGLGAIGLETEDAVQLLLLEVVAACRLWAVQNVEKPPKAYLNCAIRRRNMKLWSEIQRANKRKAIDDFEIDEVIDDNRDDGFDHVQDLERQDSLRIVDHALRMHLSPADYTLIRLRADGWSNREIAVKAGIQTKSADVGGRVRRKVYEAKQRAKDVLTAVGIESVEDAVLASTETRNAVWEAQP